VRRLHFRRCRERPQRGYLIGERFHSPLVMTIKQTAEGCTLLYPAHGFITTMHTPPSQTEGKTDYVASPLLVQLCIYFETIPPSWFSRCPHGPNPKYVLLSNYPGALALWYPTRYLTERRRRRQHPISPAHQFHVLLIILCCPRSPRWHAVSA
jgi:hypothetical protein